MNPVRLVLFLFLLSLTASFASAADSDADFVKGLAGVWRAPTDTLELRNDYDSRIWGPHSSRVRQVELIIQSSGKGVLTVQTSVIDEKGVARQYSAFKKDVELQIGPPIDRSPTQLKPMVTIVKAEDHALDGSGDWFAMPDLKVALSTTPDDPNALSIQIDLAKGDGFGQVLTRQRPKSR